MSYNRYKSVSQDGRIELLPGITVPSSSKEEIWRVNFSRMDLISYKYYGDANYDWLIFYANSNIPCIEADIQDGTVLSIPYPLSDALSAYQNAIGKYRELYSFT
jgi:hypothetical protein